MPAMSRFESAFCRGAGWRAFASRIVLNWALQGQQLSGDVLEIGGGSGAMAARLRRSADDGHRLRRGDGRRCPRPAGALR